MFLSLKASIKPFLVDNPTPLFFKFLNTTTLSSIIFSLTNFPEFSGHASSITYILSTSGPIDFTTFKISSETL